MYSALREGGVSATTSGRISREDLQASHACKHLWSTKCGEKASHLIIDCAQEHILQDMAKLRTHEEQDGYDLQVRIKKTVIAAFTQEKAKKRSYKNR